MVSAADARTTLRYGQKVLLYCEERHGFVVGTNSALSPVGVQQETKDCSVPFERAIFTVAPGDGDYRANVVSSMTGEEVKFGHVIRLVHNMRQKPLLQNANLHAMVNKANQRVTLDRAFGQDTSDKWRIMPRYRLRGEGERVRSHDHIVLQAASGEAAFVHVSGTKDESSDGCFEVNCGALAIGFEMRLFDGDDVGDLRSLRGGQCVVLFHKEESRRFVADTKQLTCVLDSVEGSEGGNMQRASRTHNYKSLFILEFEDSSRGGMVGCGRRNLYRLKALCNGHYLHIGEKRPAASADEVHVLTPPYPAAAPTGGVADARAETISPAESRFEVTLVARPDECGTLLAFHQAGDDHGSMLQSGSRVFIEAPRVGECGVWLIAGGVLEPQYPRQLIKSPQIEQKILELDCREEQSMRDGVEVVRLPADEFQDVSAVMSLLPPLQTFSEGLARNELDSGKLSQVLENVRQLRRMCFEHDDTKGSAVSASNEVDGATNAIGQMRLLRQSVPHLCIEIVRGALDSPLIDRQLLNTMEVVRVGMEAADRAAAGGGARASVTAVHGDEYVPVKYADVLDLLNSCFRLVHAVVLGRPEHAVALSAYLQFLISSCGELSSALDCVAEFYRDNLALVDTPGDTKSLRYFLEMLAQRGRETSVLEVVTLFAMCGDVGLPESQKLIVERVLRSKELAKTLLLPISSSSGVLVVGVPASYGGLRGERSASDGDGPVVNMVPLTRLSDVVGSAYELQGRDAVIPYLTQQVLLFASVCAGRNASSTLAVQQLIPPELMLPLLECTDMVPELHAAFVRLFTMTLVDVDGAPNLHERTHNIRHVIDEPSLTDSYTLEEDVPGILASAKKFAMTYLKAVCKSKIEDLGVIRQLDAVVLLVGALVKRGAIMLDEYEGVVAQLTDVLDCREYGPPGAGEVDHVTAMVHTIDVLNSVTGYLLTRDVYDVVTSFVRGMDVRHLSQFLHLSPSSRMSTESRRRIERLKNSAVDAHLNTLLSLGASGGGLPEMNDFINLLSVVMTAARSESWSLRSAAIRFFCRLTNYPGELLLTLRRVQLLTSAASAQFYNRVKHVAHDLDAFSRVALAPSCVVRGDAALSSIEALLTERDSGAMIEKIAMLRHAQVPQMLLRILHNVPMPPKDELRLFVYNVVGLLETLVQDPLILEMVCDDVDSFVQLTTYDMNVLSLIRTLYCGKPLMAMQMPARVLREVVSCVSLEHSAAHAVALLRDLLSTKDAGGKYISKNQRAVWKALVSDPGTSRLLRLRQRWTGKRGAALRNKLLMSDEYFNHAGSLRLHVSLMEVLFLVAKENELVKAEEIRDELFGLNGIDDLVEVVTNVRLPSFYRFRFVNLLQVTVVQDAACVSSLFTHRMLPEFLKLCRVDVNQCLRRLGGTCNSAKDEELLTRIDRGVLRMKPVNDYEEAIELRRTGVDFYCMLVTHGVLPCVKHLIARFVAGTSRLSPVIRHKLVAEINEFVDCVCDLMRHIFVLNSFTDYEHFRARMPRKKCHDFLRWAQRHDFTGLGRWADDIATLTDAIPLEAPEQAADGGVGTTDEKALTGRWLEYIRKNLAEAPTNTVAHVYASAAGVILRSGKLGTSFVKTVILSMRELGEADQVRALHTLRQTISLRDGSEFDDAPLLVFRDVATEMGVLTLAKSQVDRQTAMASYFEAKPHNQVLPVVTQILSSGTARVRDAALECALVLLDGGQRAMQSSLFKSVSLRSDEDLFVVLRTEVHACRDCLRSYRYALKRGAQEEARVVLGSLSTVIMQLRYTQLLCEGHYSAMQHYLRAQQDNHVSVNVLESLVDMLEVAVDVVDATTHPLMMQLLATITETVQGPCKANQDFYVAVNIAEHLTQLMVLPLKHDTLSEESVRALRGAALNVLLALVEGRMEVPFLGGLISKLDLSMMATAMQQSAEEYEQRWGPLEDKQNLLAKSFGFVKRILSYVEKIYKRDDRDETNDELCVAVDIFVFFKTCLDLQTLVSYTGKTHEFVDRRGQTIRAVLAKTTCYKAVNKLVGCVEILREGGLERSYFRILSKSRDNLRDHSKDAVIKSVDRSSDNKRLSDFFEHCQKLMLELDFYAEMRDSPLLSFIHDYAAEFDVLGLLVSFVINLIMLVTYRTPDNPYDDPVPKNIRDAVAGLAIVLIVFQCMLFVNFFFGPTRVYLEGRWLRWQDEKVAGLIEEHRAALGIEHFEEDTDFLAQVTPMQYYVQSAYYLLQYGQFYQLGLYLVCAVLGYVISPIFFSIQLLQITSKSEQLYNVVLAVLTKLWPITLTIVLMVCVQFIFAVVIFVYYTQIFDPVQLGAMFQPNQLFKVLMVSFDGIRADGGFADVSFFPSLNEDAGREYVLVRFIAWATVKALGLLLLLGIIVDSFKQLRASRDAMEQDQVKKCFVCGIEQNEFDRIAPGGFELHIRNEHHMWNYVYFFHLIKEKGARDLNGQQLFVWRHMKSKEASFFPIGRAMMLHREESLTSSAQKLFEERKTITDSALSSALTACQEKMDRVSDRVKRLEDAVALRGPKMRTG